MTRLIPRAEIADHLRRKGIRTSMRTLDTMRADGRVSCVMVGGRVYYDPDTLMAELMTCFANCAA